MVGWHHRLNGHEFKQSPGDSEGQGSLVCYSPWGHKELDTTEQLNNNNLCHTPVKDCPSLSSIIFHMEHNHSVPLILNLSFITTIITITIIIMTTC